MRGGGGAFNDPQQLFGADGIGSMFGAKDMSVSQGSESSAQPSCSNGESADSVVSTKTEPSYCYSRQALSFSGLNGESSAGDFQEREASIMGESPPPWCSPSFPSTD